MCVCVCVCVCVFVCLCVGLSLPIAGGGGGQAEPINPKPSTQQGFWMDVPSEIARSREYVVSTSTL